MQTADVVVMVLYGAVVLGIGFVANRRQKDSEDYFLGGRKLKWWAVGISLIATSFSSASLIGGTGFGYSNGLGYLQWQIGDLIAILIVCAVFLPFFAAQPITTAYEWLEKRFGRRARVVGSLLFLAQTAVRASVLVYGPALAIQAVLGWSVESSIVLSAAAAIAYSAFGGIAAVVWTDCIQFGVIVFAVIAALFMVGSDVPGGLGAVLDHASEHERLQAVSFELNPKSPFNLLAAVVPYMFLALSLFGTGQQAVQRFLSCSDLKSARRAALTGWLAGSIALSITLLLGVAIFAWQELAPAAEGFAIDKGDKVLPKFLVTRMPAGMAGLMLAAIFAASMSSLDSAVHAMSTSFMVDIVRRRDLRLARIATIVVGVIATFGALAAARSETGLLETMASWLAYFAGPMLGLFLLGMLTKVREGAALFGAATGVLLVFVLAWYQNELPFHRLWLCPIATVATVVAGAIRGRS
ncbi:MAG: sodium:solute symporter family transporter [Planctomycetota bacterium]|jgi:SSS family solute:Na+ symporter